MNNEAQTDENWRQKLEAEIERMDGAIERAKAEKESHSGPARRQSQDRLDHLRHERRIKEQHLKKLTTTDEE